MGTKNEFNFNGPASGVFGSSSTVNGGAFNASSGSLDQLVATLVERLANVEGVDTGVLEAASQELAAAHGTRDSGRLRRAVASVGDLIRSAGQSALPALDAAQKIQDLLS